MLFKEIHSAAALHGNCTLRLLGAWIIFIYFIEEWVIFSDLLHSNLSSYSNVIYSQEKWSHHEILSEKLRNFSLLGQKKIFKNITSTIDVMESWLLHVKDGPFWPFLKEQDLAHVI